MITAMIKITFSPRPFFCGCRNSIQNPMQNFLCRTTLSRAIRYNAVSQYRNTQLFYIIRRHIFSALYRRIRLYTMKIRKGSSGIYSHHQGRMFSGRLNDLYQILPYPVTDIDLTA